MTAEWWTPFTFKHFLKTQLTENGQRWSMGNNKRSSGWQFADRYPGFRLKTSATNRIQQEIAAQEEREQSLLVHHSERKNVEEDVQEKVRWLYLMESFQRIKLPSLLRTLPLLSLGILLVLYFSDRCRFGVIHTHEKNARTPGKKAEFALHVHCHLVNF